MGRFDEQIEYLKRRIDSPMVEVNEKESIVRQIKDLMELDGWVPGEQAERLSSLEKDVETIKKYVLAMNEKVEDLESNAKTKMGFRSE